MAKLNKSNSKMVSKFEYRVIWTLSQFSNKMWISARFGMYITMSALCTWSAIFKEFLLSNTPILYEISHFSKHYQFQKNYDFLPDFIDKHPYQALISMYIQTYVWTPLCTTTKYAIIWYKKNAIKAAAWTKTGKYWQLATFYAQ